MQRGGILAFCKQHCFCAAILGSRMASGTGIKRQKKFVASMFKENVYFARFISLVPALFKP